MNEDQKVQLQQPRQHSVILTAFFAALPSRRWLFCVVSMNKQQAYMPLIATNWLIKTGHMRAMQKINHVTRRNSYL